MGDKPRGRKKAGSEAFCIFAVHYLQHICCIVVF